MLFLISILHQTATKELMHLLHTCCSLSVFYIKPQQLGSPCRRGRVVPYQYSTSNRNSSSSAVRYPRVVPYQYSTSNRNPERSDKSLASVVPYQYSTSNRNPKRMFNQFGALFLISILHQTATYALYLIHNQ